MAVLITSDNDKELYLVKTMIDLGSEHMTKKMKKEYEKKGIPTSVKITFHKIDSKILDKFRKPSENDDDDVTS